MRSITKPRYKTAKIAPSSRRVDIDTACAGLTPIRFSTVGIQYANRKRFSRLQKKMIQSRTVCKAYPWPNNIEIGFSHATSVALLCDADAMSRRWWSVALRGESAFLVAKNRGDSGSQSTRIGTRANGNMPPNTKIMRQPH